MVAELDIVGPEVTGYEVERPEDREPLVVDPGTVVLSGIVVPGHGGG